MKKLYPLVLLICLSISASAQTTRYVRTDGAPGAGGNSWAAAGNNLQATITASAAGDSICVAAGTYQPAAGSSFVMKNGVKLLGGFPASGNPALTDRNWDNYPSVLQGNGERVLFNNFNIGNTTVIDGFTIRGGATASTGGGIYNVGGALPQIRNCLFEQNQAGQAGGAFYHSGGSFTLSNCTFRNNAAPGSSGQGGAVYVTAASAVRFDHCWFTGNSATKTGGAISVATLSSLILENCRFTANQTTATSNDAAGGAIFLLGVVSSNSRFTNCLFTGNVSRLGPALRSYSLPALAIGNCTFSGNTANGGTYVPKGAIVPDGFSVMTITNSIVYGNTAGVTASGSGNAVTYQYSLIQGGASGTGNLAGSPDPLFVNPVPDHENGDYSLRPCSPAIDKGNNTGVPAGVTTDLEGNVRIQYGTVDLGAYETESAAVPPADPATAGLPGWLGQSIQFQAANTTTHYLGDDCSSLIASVTSTGFSGLTGARVWVETEQPAGFVARHYEITPRENAGSATGTVTLYFTQEEFTAFNAVSAQKLPTGPADVSGIANLRIEKRSGESSDFSGSPSSYPGAPVTIDPADADIQWNAIANRWEITFSVTGFSGFFVKATDSPLPLRLLRFTAVRENGVSRLNWETADEERVSHFAVERSSNGTEFSTLATVPARNSALQSYVFRDTSPFLGTRYYRLRMVDEDGSFVRSRTLSLVEEGTLVIGPNPATGTIRVLTEDPALTGTEIQVLDMTGSVRQRVVLLQQTQEIAIHPLPAGAYLLRFGNGRTVRFVKQ
ncbi:right-handed parallel beta-helix repeat-containing protein [Siphonobacter aquaeclarae]|uniref:Por secretion system C-terminal sorting domain-containing protein n=1 Tax=Siphonobacter aquaeclarae TaxID=563176 RepID=A0A1G9Y551_9BACT|nr:right-handed parallel beta-helix repeat-containing protein [Siphonobacter aquaeclarae]SDN04214.1 Por secretion system C-terminal sorting domain-containing protein [Siphonobacter aquaeclarae]